jgi:prephenate dehydratase
MTKISLLGNPGNFHHQAALQCLSLVGISETDVDWLFQPQFNEVFTDLIEERVHLAIVAQENNAVGLLPEISSLLRQYQNEIRIISQFSLPIHHYLIGLPGSQFSQLTDIFSHPAALKQCSKFFSSHPQLISHSSSDTSQAVIDIVRHNNPRQAAIAGELAAELYGGVVLLREIENIPDNSTTFLVLEKIKMSL